MHRYTTLPAHTITHTDYVRFCVILSLSLSSIFISSLALSQNIPMITPQLFYFPIIYAAYFYRHRGIYVAGACAIAYQAIAYYYIFPSIFDMGYATGQSVLFICIAATVSHFTERLATSEGRYRSIFENSRVGIVFFNRETLAIVMVNEHMAKILGYSHKEIERLKLSRLFFSREDEKKFFRQSGSTDGITDMETQFVTKCGDPVRVNISWGRPYGNLMSISIIDIRQQKVTPPVPEIQTRPDQNRLLMDTAPTGMVLIQDNRVAQTNPAFAAFTGFSCETLNGTDIAEIVHPDDQREFRDLLSKTAGSAGGNREFRFITKAGEVKVAAVFFTPIVDGGVQSLLITLVDMTERESLREIIREDNKRRRGIITTVAHELRTPLQPLIGYLELLTNDKEEYGISDETEKILGKCLKSADRERQIINQMIHLSVIESGKLPVNYSAFSVPALIKNVISASGHSMTAEITCDVPQDLIFIADSHKISIVLDSILTNAIQYSIPPRKVRIAYHSAPDDPYHRLSVCDNGIGITKTHLDIIFEPFHIADSDQLSRKYDRIGLSLSIAKKYLQMHGGYISVESVVNRGSTFTLHIPKTPHTGEIVPEPYTLWL